MNQLMACGHISNGHEYLTDKPLCIICDCAEVADILPDLTGRKAKCSQHTGGGDGLRNSSFDLPFFEYRPLKEFDFYYCGCGGFE